MDQKDLLDLALAQSAQLCGYWTLYIAVTGTLVGVLTAQTLVLSGTSLRIAATLLFVLFSGSNLWAILRVVQVRTVALSMINDKELLALKKAAGGSEPWMFILFHITFDLASVIAIWCLHR